MNKIRGDYMKLKHLKIALTLATSLSMNIMPMANLKNLRNNRYGVTNTQSNFAQIFTHQHRFANQHINHTLECADGVVNVSPAFLEQCKTLKDAYIESNKLPETFKMTNLDKSVSFTAPSISKKAVKILQQSVRNPEVIKSLTTDEIKEAFKTADYLEFVSPIVESLAKAYLMVRISEEYEKKQQVPEYELSKILKNIQEEDKTYKKAHNSDKSKPCNLEKLNLSHSVIVTLNIDALLSHFPKLTSITAEHCGIKTLILPDSEMLRSKLINASNNTIKKIVYGKESGTPYCCEIYLNKNTNISAAEIIKLRNFVGEERVIIEYSMIRDEIEAIREGSILGLVTILVFNLITKYGILNNDLNPCSDKEAFELLVSSAILSTMPAYIYLATKYFPL